MNRSRSWVATLAALALACLGAMPAASQQPKAKRWAIVVGIDRYESDDITPLRYAVADAKALAAELKRSGAFDTVLLMTSETTDLKSHDYPKAANILARIEGNAGKIGPDDTFLFYFSGHGFQPDGSSQFLGTIETDCRTATTLEQTALSLSRLARAIGTLRARNVLLLVDACRSSPERGKSEGDNLMAPDFATRLVEVARARSGKRTGGGSPVAAVLSACSPGERSWEDPKLSHGVFTHYLLDGLRALAASPGGVEFTDLAAHVDKRVSEWCVSSGKAQTPYVKWEGAPKLVLIERAGAAASMGTSAVSNLRGMQLATHDDLVMCASAVDADTDGTNEDGACDVRVEGADRLIWEAVGPTGRKETGYVLVNGVWGTLRIPAGTLAPGTYSLRVTGLRADDTEFAVPFSRKLHVACRGAAFLVGLDRGPGTVLFHAANDALTVRDELYRRGYSERNVVYLAVQRDGSVLSDEASERRGPARGDAVGARDREVEAGLERAFARFRSRLNEIQARHALVFVSGHGGVDRGRVVLWLPAGPPVPLHRWATESGMLVEEHVRGDWDRTQYKARRGTVVGLYDCGRKDTDNGVTTGGDPAWRMATTDYVSLFGSLPGQDTHEPGREAGLAFEGRNVENGYFTFALTEAMRRVNGPATIGPVWALARTIFGQLIEEARKQDALDPRRVQELARQDDLPYGDRVLCRSVRASARPQ